MLADATERAVAILALLSLPFIWCLTMAWRWLDHEVRGYKW